MSKYNNDEEASFGGWGTVYIHIPFCKQACHYCDFHFSTSLKKKDVLVNALAKEMELRKDEFKNKTVETIYFGGGTPSLLTVDELGFLIDTVYKNYQVVDNPEITLEANPDDLSNNLIIQLSKSPINRLSIGVQSFYEADLKLMNRAHNATEAKSCLLEATKHFKNISVDLIYGIPGLTNENWIKNIETVLSFNIPHISSYALTVEPKTALDTFIKKGLIKNVDDDLAQEQFHILIEKLEASGFIHYELSNFGKPEYFSKNNSAYWQGKSYLGVGPSAHSFNGNERGWNVRNNSKYIKSIEQNVLPIETETLSITDKYNEYVMTGLRTVWGISLDKVKRDFGDSYLNYLLKASDKFVNLGLLVISCENEESNKKVLTTTRKGKFLADGLASDLFMI
uniref:radical SAM family heme chaperone HemW n=1 Tax=Mariniflexile litorale TaxID=3045158 RepID=UPI003F68EA2E